jgi:hypothetical protein
MYIYFFNEEQNGRSDGWFGCETAAVFQFCPELQVSAGSVVSRSQSVIKQ